VNAEPAIADDIVEFVESDLTAIVLFAGAARQEPAIVDREHKRIEQFLVRPIEGDVYENGIFGIWHRCEAPDDLPVPTWG
jgi:hypothetical protein